MSYNPQNPNGQATMANSSPVVIASNQSSVPVTASAGTNLNTSALALETGGNLATLAGSVTSSVVQTNVKQMNGVTTSMGNGTTDTGTQRVTLSSDGTGQVILTDGTNKANVIAGDAGNNSQVIASGRKEVSYTTTSVQAVATTDISNYSWVVIHQTTTGGSSLATFQTSNDNTNWNSLTLQQTTSVATTSSASSTSSALIMFAGPLNGRYFRLNVTGIVSGTTAGVVEFFTQPRLQNGYSPIQVTKSSNTSTGSSTVSAVFGTAISANVKNGAGQLFAISISSIDTNLVYFQIFNKASAPATNDVPIYSFPVGAATATSPSWVIMNESFFGLSGRQFTTGISWGISSVNATYTASVDATSNFNVHTHYL